MALGARLKRLRLKKGESLQQTADAAGVSKAHIWDLETGKSANPSMELLTSLASARAELLPQARAQGIYTDEDVFAIVS